MKLEYLPEINPDYPQDDLIRLFDFNHTEVKKFQTIIEHNLLKEGKSVALSSLNFIHEINCSLTLKLNHQNLGIQKTEENIFYCELTKYSYREMIHLVQPFIDKDTNGYQWLYDIDPKICTTELLFSSTGLW